MLSRRSAIIVALGCAAGQVLPLAHASGDTSPSTSPKWTRDDKDPRWVQGEVILPAPPEAVWSRLGRVSEWPRIFTDIKSLRIVDRIDETWNMKVESRTFAYGPQEYHARLDPSARTARGWVAGAGVSAVNTMRIFDGSAPRTSRAVCSLFIDARGIAAWVLGKDEIHRKQEHMVVQYLADFERAFGARP
jgi:hypothetical protein